MLMNRISWKVSWINPNSIYLYVALFYKLSFRFEIVDQEAIFQI
jgi:hypothetical protein